MSKYPLDPDYVSLSGSAVPSTSLSCLIPDTLENKINVEFSDTQLRVYADVNAAGLASLRRLLMLRFIK